MSLAVPATLAGASSGPTDPVRYYRHPLVGWLFRRRIEMGLGMLPPLGPAARVLEVGYGAGLVLYNLAPRAAELHGLDLDADPAAVSARLCALGIVTQLAQGSVLDMRPHYADGYFDAVVCFSVFEHLAQPAVALDEVARVLKPRGVAVIGMPAVNGFMEWAFQGIGFKGIEDHHVTKPARIRQLVRANARPWQALAHRALPAGAPFPLALYHCFRLQRR